MPKKATLEIHASIRMIAVNSGQNLSHRENFIKRFEDLEVMVTPPPTADIGMLFGAILPHSVAADVLRDVNKAATEHYVKRLREDIAFKRYVGRTKWIIDMSLDRADFIPTTQPQE